MAFTPARTGFIAMTDSPSPHPNLGIEKTVAQTSPPQALPQQRTTTTYEPSSASAHTSSFAGNLSDLMRLLEQSQLPGGPTIVAGYKLLHAIGQGGFGCVWAAQDLSTDETVAIKFLVRQSRDTVHVLEEVKHLASVQGCFGVVPIRAVRESGVPPHFIPYYVMQYASGGSVQKLLDERGRLPAGDAVRLMLPVLRAMAFIHSRQVVHSDLKPGNLLINEANEPLIADFGQAQRHATSSGQGTYFYMAPERATIEKLRPDPRWDVYSIGAVMYALLTGDPPRKSPELSAVMKAAPYDERLRVYREGLAQAPAPTSHRQFCDRELASIIDRCLRIDPNRRPSDAGEVLQLMERRAYLRRTKPVIRLGIAATVAFFTIFLPLIAYGGMQHIDGQRGEIEASVKDALKEKVYLGSQIIENALADRIGFVEYHANERCRPEIREALEKIGQQIQKQYNHNPNDPQGIDFEKQPAAYDLTALIDRTDRVKIDQWLLNDVYSVLARRHPTGTKTLAVHVAVKDEVASKIADSNGGIGRGLYRSYIISRIEGHGREYETVSNTPNDDRNLRNPAIYKKNWAFRDYFNGQGTDYNHKPQDAYPVIERTHIGHTFLSRAQSSIESKSGKHRWKLDISTPIWSERIQWNEAAGKYDSAAADLQGRSVLAILVCGMFVDDDLESDFQLPVQISSESTHSEFVLLNDRNCWALHSESMRDRLLDPDKPDVPTQLRDPDQYDPKNLPPLPDQTLHACKLPPPEWFNDNVNGRRLTKRAYPQAATEYVDFVRDRGNPETLIAGWNYLRPFRDSYYNDLQEKHWVLIAQVDRQSTLGKVEAIRDTMLRQGLFIVACLLVLVVVLWVWLVRLVRRAEFAGHG